jgi:hypothetical protein
MGTAWRDARPGYATGRLASPTRDTRRRLPPDEARSCGSTLRATRAYQSDSSSKTPSPAATSHRTKTEHKPGARDPVVLDTGHSISARFSARGPITSRYVNQGPEGFRPRSGHPAIPKRLCVVEKIRSQPPANREEELARVVAWVRELVGGGGTGTPWRSVRLRGPLSHGASDRRRGRAGRAAGRRTAPVSLASAVALQWGASYTSTTLDFARIFADPSRTHAPHRYSGILWLRR